MKRAARGLPLLLALLAAVLFLALGGTRYVTLAALSEHARWLRHTADDWGIAAPLLFILANAALLMVLVVPAWFCTIVGGLLFGRWLGTAYALLGTTLGACGVFLAARAGLAGVVERAGPRASAIGEEFRKNAWSYLLFLRIVPLFPFVLVNVAAALGRLPLKTYALGTLIGIIPSVLIYASLGDFLMDMAQHDRPPDANPLLEARFLLPLLALAALALLPAIVGRLRRRR
ncbi:MAG: TVP38/TMEM64 family protein [Alphaproteobacteria bacterium]|nr:TVP38/TMEM64 family protein [Alphaproteobacteria bacterium]